MPLDEWYPARVPMTHRLPSIGRRKWFPDEIEMELPVHRGKFCLGFAIDVAGGVENR